MCSTVTTLLVCVFYFRGSALLTPPKQLKSILGAYEKESLKRHGPVKRRLIGEGKKGSVGEEFEQPNIQSNEGSGTEHGEVSGSKGRKRKSTTVKLPPPKKPKQGGSDVPVLKRPKKVTLAAKETPKHKKMDHSVAVLISALAQKLFTLYLKLSILMSYKCDLFREMEGLIPSSAVLQRHFGDSQETPAEQRGSAGTNPLTHCTVVIFLS